MDASRNEPRRGELIPADILPFAAGFDDQSLVGIHDDVVVNEGVAIQLLEAFTRMEAACAAAKTKVTHLLHRSRLAKVEEGLPDNSSKTLRSTRIAAACRSTGAEVALAKQQPPSAGARMLEQARLLCEELPHTFTELSQGRLTPQRAVLIAEAAGRLPEGVRPEFDRRAALVTAGKSDARVRDALRGLTYELDPAGVLARNRRDVKERFVSVRPYCEGMGRLTIVAPLAHAVAAYASLKRHADLARNVDGDTRTRAQLHSDEAISRLTCGAVQGCDADGVPLRWSEPTLPSPTLDDVQSATGERLADESRWGANATATEGDPVAEVRARSRSAKARPEDPVLVEGALDFSASESACESEPAPALDRESVAESWMDDRGPAASEGAEGSDVTAHRPAPPPTGAPQIHLHLILTDRTLLGESDEPAELVGHGPVSPAMARRLAVLGAGRTDDARTTIRRYVTDPVNGRLSDCDPRARFFPDVMKEFLMVRDRTCRTVWCGAPIRHGDHVVRHSDGGGTTVGNGQGLCQQCNLVKESGSAAIGHWSSSRGHDGDIITTTPTGHSYVSREPGAHS